MWRRERPRVPGATDPGREVEDELEFHLQMAAEELERKGLSPREARLAAERAFGDLEETREYCRGQDRRRRQRLSIRGFVRTPLDEGKLALRSLTRRPASVVTPVLILTLAVALNALVLSVVGHVLLAPLPFTDPGQVVAVQEMGENGSGTGAAYPILDEWRRDARGVEVIAGYLEDRLPALSASGPVHLGAAKVTWGFFSLLENPLRTGRPFAPEEHTPGGPSVVAISEGLWEGAFGGDPEILGRTLVLEGRSHQVVAVVRSEAVFPDNAQIWLPVEAANPDLLEIPGAKIFSVLARRRTGVTLQALTRELSAISARVPGGAQEALTVPLDDEILAKVRGPLLLLQGAVLLVLLAAAANAGSLLLARGVRRRGEMALRASLGAGAGRVMTGLLLEGSILGAAAGIAGLALAALALQPALALVPVELPRAQLIALSPQVSLAVFGLATLTGILTTLLPALAGGRTSPAETLRESATGSGTPPWVRRTLDGFVVTQVALAMVLTAGAGLLIQSFVSSIREDPGFETTGVTLLDVSLPEFRYTDQESRVAFGRELLERARGLSGTEAAALGRNLPISGTSMTSPLRVEGWAETTSGVQVAMVTADYFQLLGIPFLEGGGFGQEDRVDGPPLLVVDPGVPSPQGAPLGLGSRAHSFFGVQEFREVVGVVGAVRHRGLRVDPVPVVYEPFFQKGGSAGFTLLVRSEAPPGVVAQRLRELVREMDPELAVDQVSTMGRRIRASLAEPRFYTVVMSTFGFLAVLLALAGCQAGLAHRVAARRREVGIRMALGAPRPSVRRMIVLRGLFLTGVGATLGTLAAIPGTRLLESQLYQVSSTDPLTYGALFLLLLATGSLASDLPARKAARVDPAEVLRKG